MSRPRWQSMRDTEREKATYARGGPTLVNVGVDRLPRGASQWLAAAALAQKVRPELSVRVTEHVREWRGIAAGARRTTAINCRLPCSRLASGQDWFLLFASTSAPSPMGGLSPACHRPYQAWDSRDEGVQSLSRNGIWVPGAPPRDTRWGGERGDRQERLPNLALARLVYHVDLDV